MQIGIRQGKRHTGQNPEGDHVQNCWPSLTCRVIVYLLLAMLRDKMYRGLPTRDTRPNFWCPEFLLGLSYRLPMWLTFHLQPLLEVRLVPVASSSPGGRKWYGMAQTPIINHVVRLSLAKVSRQTGTLLSGNIFQGLRDHLPEAKGKDQSSLWVRLILHYIEVYFSKWCISSLVTQNPTPLE